MTFADPPGTFWPSPVQRRLLAVAFDEPEAAIEHWRGMEPPISLDHLEQGSFALLPLIYRNLSRAGVDDSRLPRLKGIYRKTWATNSLLVERTREIGRCLEGAGVPALFVEGVAVAERFYPELGLRPTHAVDVLLADGNVEAGLAALAESGWLEQPGRSHGPRDDRYLVDREGNECAVRTTLAIDAVSRGGIATATVWGAPEQWSLGDVRLLAPTATDALFAISATHARAGGGRRPRWLADAKMLLRAEIEWDRVLELAVEYGQELRLRDVLRYLGASAGPRPPALVAEQLADLTATRRTRLTYRCTSGSIAGPGALPWLLAEHLAATSHLSPLQAALTFPRHLRDRWGLTRTWHVPFAAGRRAIRVLGARVRGAA